MATTVRTRSFAFTEDMERKLAYLKEKLGESNSQVMKKALSDFYDKEFKKNEGY